MLREEELNKNKPKEVSFWSPFGRNHALRIPISVKDQNLRFAHEAPRIHPQLSTSAWDSRTRLSVPLNNSENNH